MIKTRSAIQPAEVAAQTKTRRQNEQENKKTADLKPDLQVKTNVYPSRTQLVQILSKLRSLAVGFTDNFFTNTKRKVQNRIRSSSRLRRGVIK